MDDLFRMKILIIDDDMSSVALLQRRLESSGYTDIQTTTSAKEGLLLVQKDPPDLVILDIVMPEMDGYGFCKQLRKKKQALDIPVIMMTGAALDSDEAIKKTFDAGSTDFITKPIKNTEFLARVKTALTLKKAHDDLKKELAKRKRSETKQKKLVKELQEALNHVKQLQGMLPICAECKKIKDDTGYWQKLEEYIEERSETEFTHGLCPECALRLYPDIDWEFNKK